MFLLTSFAAQKKKKNRKCHKYHITWLRSHPRELLGCQISLHQTTTGPLLQKTTPAFEVVVDAADAQPAPASYFQFRVYKQELLPLVHSASCLCCLPSTALWQQTAHDWFRPSNGLSGPAEEMFFVVLIRVFSFIYTADPAVSYSIMQQGSKSIHLSCFWLQPAPSSAAPAPAEHSPGSLSSAAPCLAPCGWSLALSRRCFAPLGWAPGTSGSSAQTVRPALSERPGSRPCRNR